MRKVTVRFMGPLRKPEGVDSEGRFTVEAETTVDDLLAQLGYGESERSRIRVLVGGSTTKRDDILGQAEEVTLFLPLGGG